MRAPQPAIPSAPATAALPDDPLWYKDAVIYELRVRSFSDSNADGIGDFPGLTQRIDYLHDLGVTALWLLPFYPSPGRDDGYDISDYTDVNVDYGRLEDFKEFLEAAHARGMRVITELVINHTSDQHPWFQAARRAPPGSPRRDFYIWSDTPDRYRDARIIFKDFESSNWAWDPLAKAYYWHRFFSHQPDLNFRNPEVQQAVFSVCDFWLDLGVDGMRLDAIPYLFEAEGTNCENLPETHAFLKSLRAHIDGKYRNRMLLAEANQWPEDAAAYFGAGDECNMNFNFPIMPRIFMSIHMEDQLPISDIFAQTPPIPDSCQWALFLRNHDELTLEMVTDEERDYMYRAFANDPTMRINLGIRRRLAPLLQNDRPNIELMNGLLFSLPGTPVLYYGDELGMGDNVYLGDRNGVRTPMQWSSDRNAGFSKANPQRLMLPVIIDPEYHYESINVEAQQSNPHSLLWWMKRLIGLRKRNPVFGRGKVEFLQPDNSRVLAFLRQLDTETVLVVANLSRTVQYVELDLAKYKGLLPVEMFGSTTLPPIGDLPYLLTLGGHAFYWFSLQRTALTAEIARTADYQPAVLTLNGPPAEVFDPEQRDALESALPNFLRTQHWFQRRTPLIDRVTVTDVVDLGAGLHWVKLAVRVVGSEELEPWAVFLSVQSGSAATEGRARNPRAVVALLHGPDGASESSSVALMDATGDIGSGHAVLDLLGKPRTVPARGGVLEVESYSPLPAASEALEPWLPRRSHETTALIFGDSLALKVAHRLIDGLSPDLELTHFLAGRSPPAPVVPLVSSLIYRPRRGDPQVVATLHGYVHHDNTGWELVLAEISRFYERALTRSRAEPPPAVPSDIVAELGQTAFPPEVVELIGAFPQTSRLMGQRVGELHRALSSDLQDPSFAPEPYGVLDQRSFYQSMRNLVGDVLRRVRRGLPLLAEPLRPLAHQLLERSELIYQRLQPLLGRRLTALRTRTHGDLDLAHLLYSGKDFTVIDFDGDRRRSLVERRRKHSPLRDVAHLLTSLHRAAFVGLKDDAVVRSPDRTRAEHWALWWFASVGGAFLQRYQEVIRGAPFPPKDDEEWRLLLHVFLLEEALTNLGRELDQSAPILESSLRLLLHLLWVAPPPVDPASVPPQV